MSGPRKGISKRRWKARARMGRWLPLMVIVAIDKDPSPISERWELHDIHTDFWRLKKPPGSSAKQLPQLAEVAEVGL